MVLPNETLLEGRKIETEGLKIGWIFLKTNRSTACSAFPFLAGFFFTFEHPMQTFFLNEQRPVESSGLQVGRRWEFPELELAIANVLVFWEFRVICLGFMGFFKGLRGFSKVFQRFCQLLMIFIFGCRAFWGVLFCIFSKLLRQVQVVWVVLYCTFYLDSF